MDALALHDYYWGIWVAIFLVYEIYAAINKKKGDTLSETVWDVFAIRRPHAKYGRARRFILMSFMVALTSHFVYDTSSAWIILFGVGMGASGVYHYVVERRKE